MEAERIKAKETVMRYLIESKKNFIRCPICNAGVFGGMLEIGCDNECCILYKKHSMRKCHIHGIKCYC